MGFADSLAGRLFLVRRKSDLEYQIQIIMERKMAILDECNTLSAQMSNEIFQTGDHTTTFYGGVFPGNLPGVIPPNGYIPPIPVPTSSMPTGNYESRLAALQVKEKELDIRQKKMETELEAVKAEEESLKKIADDHVKKDFKVG
jgi:hypothetical protein